MASRLRLGPLFCGDADRCLCRSLCPAGGDRNPEEAEEEATEVRISRSDEIASLSFARDLDGTPLVGLHRCYCRRLRGDFVPGIPGALPARGVLVESHHRLADFVRALRISSSVRWGERSGGKLRLWIPDGHVVSAD